MKASQMKGQEPDHSGIDPFNSKASQGATRGGKVFFNERIELMVDPAEGNRHRIGTGMTPAHAPSVVRRMSVVKTSVTRASTSVDAFLGGRTKSLRLIQGDKYAPR